MSITFAPPCEEKRRFWQKVDRHSSPQGCWIWMCGVFTDGYGAFRMRNKQFRAHRASWILAFGEIPRGRFVLHRCDNPRCVNPDHLFLGDALSNARDRENKGRGKRLHGSNSPLSKLTLTEVAEIRHMAERGHNQNKIAAKFGVIQSAISLIVLGKRYASTLKKELTI